MIVTNEKAFTQRGKREFTELHREEFFRFKLV